MEVKNLGIKTLQLNIKLNTTIVVNKQCYVKSYAEFFLHFLRPT